MKLKYLLSDLDGVIRKFPKLRDHAIEEKYNLPDGSLLEAAFEKKILNQVVCGEITDPQWRQKMTDHLGKRANEESAQKAVFEWSDFCGELDLNYLNYIEAYFSNDHLVLLTNGTSRLNADLQKLKIEKKFHKIFNSSELGFCKPSLKSFEHVLHFLNCRADEILFVDDSRSHVEAARSLGFHAFHYDSLPAFQKFLSQLVADFWQPIAPTELTHLFLDAPTELVIAGGWGIDLFLDKVTREHADIDVWLHRKDLAALQEHLADWDFWVADPPGTLRPLIHGEKLDHPIQDIWCRKGYLQPWQFQVMLYDLDDNNWIYKRDPTIRRQIDSVICKTKKGQKILAPEVQLLYKSKNIREKDQLDFHNLCQALNDQQKNWLKQSLIKVYNNEHLWINQL